MDFAMMGLSNDQVQCSTASSLPLIFQLNLVFLRSNCLCSFASLARDSHRLELFKSTPTLATNPTALFARNAPRVDRRVTFAMVTVNADPYGMPQGATTTQLG
jgi:hypothetical protein